MSSEKTNKERAALVMVPLLLLQLALLSLQIESSSGTLLFRTWTMAAQGPIVSYSSGLIGGVRHAWRSYIWLIGARAENERLQQTVNRLLLLNSNSEQAVLENSRLRRLLAINDPIEFQTVGARIVARAPSFLSNIAYIDRGSKDGVRADAPVLSGDGIVGRVVLVSKYQSQIQLITNPDASVGALLEHTRTPGVLRGSGDLLLDLNYISNTESISIGDVVLSSGLDGIYPKGLAIGKVVDSRKGNGVFRIIKVLPDMDLIHIEEISVLLTLPKPVQETAEQTK